MEGICPGGDGTWKAKGKGSVQLRLKPSEWSSAQEVLWKAVETDRMEGGR